MKYLLNIILVSILFVSCSFTRSVSKNTEIVETEKTRKVDTNITILNPLKAQLLYASINDTINFENDFYKIVSFVDTDKHEIITQFTPKKKVVVDIKVNEKTKVTKTILSKEIETKTKNYLHLGIISIIGLLFVLILYKIFKKWLD